MEYHLPRNQTRPPGSTCLHKKLPVNTRLQLQQVTQTEAEAEEAMMMIHTVEVLTTIPIRGNPTETIHHRNRLADHQDLQEEAMAHREDHQEVHRAAHQEDQTIQAVRQLAKINAGRYDMEQVGLGSDRRGR